MKSLLPASVLVLDAACLGALLAGALGPGGAGGLLAAHAVLSLTYGLVVATGGASPAFGVLSGLLACFVPLAGPAGLLVARAVSVPRWVVDDGVETLDPDAPLDDGVLRAPIAGPAHRAPTASALSETLRRRTEASAPQRFRALLDLGVLPARRAVALLKLALTDPDDEVRLFAFSRIDRWRGDLERAIESLSASLPAAGGPRAARLHLAIAQLHWEMAYLGLVEGAVREHALRRSLEHAEAAGSSVAGAGPRDFLRGRVLLQLRDHRAARIAFEAAAAGGYPRFKVLPYLAECAFLERDFEHVRSTMRALGRPPSIPVALGPALDLWS